jgi:hypothetical protein
MIYLLCLALCQFDCSLCRWWCWCAVGGDSESLLSAFGWSWNSNFVVQYSTNSLTLPVGADQRDSIGRLCSERGRRKG